MLWGVVLGYNEGGRKESDRLERCCSLSAMNLIAICIKVRTRVNFIRMCTLIPTSISPRRIDQTL